MLLIQEYIKCYENILDPKVCERIVTEDSQNFARATTNDGDITPMRNCYQKKVNDEFDSIIFQCVGEIIKRYEKDFKYFATGLSCEDTGYHHLLYKGEEKGEYKDHVDHYDLHPRVLSCSIILNDDYDGGDFSFFEGEHRIPKKKGSAVVFPSTFCFPHAIIPVSNGDRHSIITWIH